MPPIDPLQLLKALAPLLATSGGMKSAEEVVRLSSLMKKFSRKLVSRCVYVNVLRVTSPDVLEAFLDQGGWETINNWLQDAKRSENYAFLVDLLRLFKTLPMTVGRLKQNNSAKVVKALTKSDSNDVKTLASELVESWMQLVKGNTSNSHDVKVVKKKRKREHKEYHKKEHEKDKKEYSEKDKKEHKENPDKKFSPEKKNNSVENEVRRVEKGTSKSSKVVCELEDVKLPEYLEKELSMKKPKRDRPKTVKTFHAKFRSTGLEEPPPLPKAVSKKAVGVDKAAALAAKHAVKRIGGAVSRDTLPYEKKPKPSTLIVTESNEATEKLGIKLIPAKPKPIHVIKESAGFMDALVAEPTAPTRKKRKSSRTPTTPPSPTLTTPKLQFYKDTLETQADSEKTDEKESVDSDVASTDNQETATKENVADVSIELSTDISDPDTENVPGKTALAPEKVTTTPVPAKSKAKKKKVSWADEPKLKQIYYFELDETERVNVNNEKNFGDMKTLERQKERQVVETARRMLMGDKMEEQVTWVTPFLIDMPPPLVDRGCNSTQRDIQRAREQSILQEIYFSKESIPDSPHEPDPEVIEPQEPKAIPLEDENNPDSVVDYSSMEPPAPVTVLPPALSNLFPSLNHKQTPNGPFVGEMEMPYAEEMPPEPYYKTGPPPGFPPPGLLGCAPPGFEPFGKFPPGPDNMMPPPPPQGDMGLGPPGPPNMMMPPPEEMGEYYDPMGPPMHHPPMGPHMRMNGPPRNRGSNRGRGMGPMRGPMRGRGGPPLRGQRQRTVCRNFIATNTCRFKDACLFLHPGVNGPMC